MKPSKILMVFLLMNFFTTLSFAFQNPPFREEELLFFNTNG